MYFNYNYAFINVLQKSTVIDESRTKNIGNPIKHLTICIICSIQLSTNVEIKIIPINRRGKKKKIQKKPSISLLEPLFIRYNVYKPILFL